MVDEESKIINELLKEIVSKQIDDDLKYGQQLQNICKKGDTDKGKCSDVHKVNVINYINRVDRIYHPFVMLYAKVNNIPTSKGKGPIDCHTLSTYVFIVEKVKEAKDVDDNYEHFCEQLKIKK